MVQNLLQVFRRPSQEEASRLPWVPQERSLPHRLFHHLHRQRGLPRLPLHHHRLLQDRKSTRLNSSHTVISYAVFCLKKKKPKNAASSPCAPSLAAAHVI